VVGIIVHSKRWCFDPWPKRHRIESDPDSAEPSALSRRSTRRLWDPAQRHGQVFGPNLNPASNVLNFGIGGRVSGCSDTALQPAEGQMMSAATESQNSRHCCGSSWTNTCACPLCSGSKDVGVDLRSEAEGHAVRVRSQVFCAALARIKHHVCCGTMIYHALLRSCHPTLAIEADRCFLRTSAMRTLTGLALRDQTTGAKNRMPVNPKPVPHTNCYASDHASRPESRRRSTAQLVQTLTKTFAQRRSGSLFF